jgi:hypothetical protein
MAIIDPTKITEPQLKTGMTIRLAPGSLKLTSDLLVDAGVLETLKESLVRLSISMEISPEFSEVLRKAKALKTALMRDPKILVDGGEWLIGESNISWFLEQVSFIENHIQGMLNIFDPPKVIEIRDEFETRVFEAVKAAFISRGVSDAMSSEDIDATCTSVAAVYISQSFPDVSTFSTVEVDYSLPVPCISPIPKGLSPEQEASMKAKQMATVMHIWELMISQYEAFEERAAAGGFHKMEDDIEYLNPEIVNLVEEARANSKREKAEKLAGTFVENPTTAISTVCHQFGKSTANAMTRNCAVLLSRLETSEEITSISDPECKSKLEKIKINLAAFQRCGKTWLKTKTATAGDPVEAPVDLVEDEQELELITTQMVTIESDVSLAVDDEDTEFVIPEMVIQTVDHPEFVEDEDEPTTVEIKETARSTRSKNPMVKRRA